MRSLEFTVYGKPAPQGSKSGRSICGQTARRCRNCGKAHLVKINLVEKSTGVKPWRNAVVAACRAAMLEAGWETVLRPVIFSAVFTYVRPPSHFYTGRNSMKLRPDAPARPVDADLSKLVRSTEDAITTAGGWKDDMLAADYAGTCKVYAGDGHRRALLVPGAHIIITEITEGII